MDSIKICSDSRSECRTLELLRLTHIDSSIHIEGIEEGLTFTFTEQMKVSVEEIQ